MIRSLKIQRFRCHRDITLSELGRVNLLTGMNNTGKSVALEALFLLSLAHVPTTALAQLRRLRGFSTRSESEEFWDALFYNWDSSQELVIAAEEGSLRQSVCGEQFTATGWNTLRIRSTEREEFNSAAIDLSTNPPEVIEGMELIQQVRDLLFRREPPTGEPSEELLSKHGEFLNSPIPRTSSETPVTYISSRRGGSTEDDARRFSRLEIAGRQKEVLSVLQVIEPRLRRIVVVAQHMGSILYGDIGADRLVPLSLMGDGLGRALSIALALLNAKGGIVLIDEVESGLHYSVLVDIWRMIGQTARTHRVQVFATTHSDECIRAAVEAMSSANLDKDLKLYRFDRVADGTRVVDYSTGDLTAAIRSEQEVR